MRIVHAAIKNGYIVNATGNQGTTSIVFNNNSGEGYLTATTDGPMNNSGLNAGIAPVLVGNSLYSFNYTVEYQGPAASGAYVVVNGLNKSFDGVWDIPIYSSVTTITRPTPYRQNFSVDFNPLLINQTTRYITLSIAFQYHLSQHEQSSLTF